MPTMWQMYVVYVLGAVSGYTVAARAGDEPLVCFGTGALVGLCTAGGWFLGCLVARGLAWVLCWDEFD